jgi:DNA-directed RNA polymerase specialized sigma24 family protein
MGCSRATAAVRLHRARRRLHRELESADRERACVVTTESG